MEFGNTLKAAREAKGLTCAQLAEKTRLMPGIVEDLENENFSRIAAPIYGRGFVKLYCEVVGLDPKPMQLEFMEIYNGNRAPTIRPRPAPAAKPTAEATTPEKSAAPAPASTAVPAAESETPVPASVTAPKPPPFNADTFSNSTPSLFDPPAAPVTLEPAPGKTDSFPAKPEASTYRGKTAAPAPLKSDPAFTFDHAGRSGAQYKPRLTGENEYSNAERYRTPQNDWRDGGRFEIPWRLIALIVGGLLAVVLAIKIVTAIYGALTAPDSEGGATAMQPTVTQPATTPGANPDTNKPATPNAAPGKRVPTAIEPLYFD